MKVKPSTSESAKSADPIEEKPAKRPVGRPLKEGSRKWLLKNQPFEPIQRLNNKQVIIRGY